MSIRTKQVEFLSVEMVGDAPCLQKILINHVCILQHCAHNTAHTYANFPFSLCSAAVFPCKYACLGLGCN